MELTGYDEFGAIAEAFFVIYVTVDISGGGAEQPFGMKIKD